MPSVAIPCTGSGVFGLQLHGPEPFKLYTVPLLFAKARAIVGLYLVPPAKPLAMFVEEKTKI
ncbi:MAG: hypothetical protein KC592_15940 [Nitrospira sp.]|nr:hypothetical protein [Nitrospira sp.]MCW5783317.1 hypothetical protein [Nitrospirales bacterium]